MPRECKTKAICLKKGLLQDEGSILYMAGGSECNEVKFFNQDFEVEASAYKMDRAIYTVDISDSGSYKLFGCGDGLIRVLI